MAEQTRSIAGWLEGGGIFKRGSLYYYMAGSGCCYCAGGGGAMVFVAPHPMGPWRFQTNVNDGLYLPFSPRGEPPPPPPVPAGATASCSDLSGEWASSVLTPNYQPLRAGLIVTKLDGRPHFLPPPPPPPQTTTISNGAGAHKRCLSDSIPGGHAVGRNMLVSLVPCSGSKEQQWVVRSVYDGGEVEYVNTATGRCLDAALGHAGRKVYTNGCVPHNSLGDAVGQTWSRPASSAAAIVNVAAKSCLTPQANGLVVMEAFGSGSTGQQWTVAPSPDSAPTAASMDYYNITSKSETHWPAVHAGGWLMEVDAAAKTVRWPIAARAPGSSGPTKLSPWLNPLSNGQKLPPAPDCTMLSGGQGVRLCKLPWCGESVRPVKAQQFNVLQLGGQHVYYGERWQSTPTGYKADDFSYLQPLSFDEHGVVQRLKFADSFELAI